MSLSGKEKMSRSKDDSVKGCGSSKGEDRVINVSIARGLLQLYRVVVWFEAAAEK